jgi:hypothetical protein
MTCPYADSDAAYVLGALDPVERQGYRAHLAGCERCQAAVEELSSLPGYLARLLPGADAALATPAVLPGLIERVRAQRRVARWRSVSAGVLIAAAAATTGVLVGAPEPSDDRVTVLTMSAEPGIPVEATLLVTGRGWGTSIDTRCRYDGSTGEAAASTYGLYAIDEDGSESLVSSWRQLADRELTIPGSTRLDLSDIDRLEVRTAAGETILQRSL